MPVAECDAGTSAPPGAHVSCGSQVERVSRAEMIGAQGAPSEDEKRDRDRDRKTDRIEETGKGRKGEMGKQAVGFRLKGKTEKQAKG